MASLTKKVKEQIDTMTYEALFRRWRFAPVGDPIFQGESGKYFDKVFQEKRSEVGGAYHTMISKRIGWDK